MTTSVRRARPADVPAITALLVDALSRDPVAEWLVPDADNRLDVLHRLLAVDVDHAIETGHVDVAGDWSAVAVWRRHDLDAQQWALGDYHLTTFAGQAAPRFDELNAAVRSYRSDAPHHWLSWLAVQPSYGWPVAGELLHQHHQMVDRTGHPVYAVVTTEGARDLLCQHGYRADLPLHLPSGPRLWPLTRAGRPIPNNSTS
ncbi:hypothetical protein GCE86_09060 [Micromonospora terminaliae]|uniref:N-acetyltransferase n=1 Tax=Micromonospora terminaliae TaxID=1914461 RepID=A0AAJ3DJ17_9ACTN|nr:hypothetical protein [Micromonospora terminaliae]NES28066.1 hypothetical protein [Micromonospora terminaliae]QGL47182.1 hypothetical protein GCE86_09060 [Micromonospora terminaliae]